MHPSRTWWGQRFVEALERFTDPGRLERGASYARTGRVLSYEITAGQLNARVRGSINPYFGVYKEPLYDTTLSLKQISAQDWRRVIQACAQRAGLIARLLTNELPESIEVVFSDLGLPFLPQNARDFRTHCSCPDFANPCKHVAGVTYYLASDLDQDPFLLFELRGLARRQLREELERSPLGRILSAELEPHSPEIVSAASYFTPPRRQSATTSMDHREFWVGAHRLPDPEPPRGPSVPALLIKKQGDYPAFWPREASFIGTMEQVYERIRTKGLGGA